MSPVILFLPLDVLSLMASIVQPTSSEPRSSCTPPSSDWSVKWEAAKGWTDLSLSLCYILYEQASCQDTNWLDNCAAFDFHTPAPLYREYKSVSDSGTYTAWILPLRAGSMHICCLSAGGPYFRASASIRAKMDTELSRHSYRWQTESSRSQRFLIMWSMRQPITVVTWSESRHQISLQWWETPAFKKIILMM